MPVECLEAFAGCGVPNLRGLVIRPGEDSAIGERGDGPDPVGMPLERRLTPHGSRVVDAADAEQGEQLGAGDVASPARVARPYFGSLGAPRTRTLRSARVLRVD